MHSFQFITHILQSELPSVENISKFGERTLLKDISFGINKDQKKLPSLPKTVLEKTTIMSIINGLEELTPSRIEKGIKMAFCLKTIICRRN
jgi:ATP-binding cassette subfamily F protein uup